MSALHTSEMGVRLSLLYMLVYVCVCVGVCVRACVVCTSECLRHQSKANNIVLFKILLRGWRGGGRGDMCDETSFRRLCVSEVSFVTLAYSLSTVTCEH